MKINIASVGGFRYSIRGSACNRKPRGDSILVVVNSTTYFKLKMMLMGGYRGMSGYWNKYGIHSTVPYSL